jgi:aminopeptidase-like protein
VCTDIVEVLEGNQRYVNQNPYCEPQLGRRNLYRPTGANNIEDAISARLWVLNLSDGDHSLLDIADRAGLNFSLITDAADALRAGGLLAPAS